MICTQCRAHTDNAWTLGDEVLCEGCASWLCVVHGARVELHQMPVMDYPGNHALMVEHALPRWKQP